MSVKTSEIELKVCSY